MSVMGGAAATLHGLLFEQKTDLVKAVEGAGYIVKIERIRRNRKDYPAYVVYEGMERIGFFAKQWSFYYNFVEAKGIDWKMRLSKRYLPDEAFINEKTNTVHIIEKKFQNRHGSTDEKLESCAYKLDRYTHLLVPTGMKVQYTYLCNEWFKKPKYRDVIDYIWRSKCRLYFNTLPISELGLHEHKNEHPQRDVMSAAGVFLYLFNVEVLLPQLIPWLCCKNHSDNIFCDKIKIISLFHTFLHISINIWVCYAKLVCCYSKIPFGRQL